MRPGAKAIVLAMLLALVASGAVAQEAEDPSSEPVEEQPSETTAEQDLGTFGEGSVDFGAVDALLEQDEQVLTDPNAYSYDPGARRDPFRSLIQRVASEEGRDRDRPEGVPGLLIDEIVIEGIFMLADGPVAQVAATNKDTSYLIRPGDQLWDGEVVSMTLDEVVFKQDVDDPTVLRPFREVIKKLGPVR